MGHIINELVELGVKTVNLGGNEPIFTNGPNINDTLLPFIIKELTHAGIVTGFTTNGITFNYLYKNHLDILSSVNDIDFSLDSPYRCEHDGNRRAKLYDIVIDGIEQANELGIDCSIITVGFRTTFNQRYLSAFLQLTKLLETEFRINTLKPVEEILQSEMPSCEQFYNGFAYLLKSTACVTLGESCLTALTGAGSQGCPCGHYSFRINAKTTDGRVPISPCVYAHDFRTGDLLTQPIQDIVNMPDFVSFQSRWKNLPESCKETDCDFLEICRGGCTSRAYLVNGSLDAKDPYCLKDYLEQMGGSVEEFPRGINIGHDGIRVHDNYLCTWIGKSNGSVDLPKSLTIDDFKLKECDGDVSSSLLNLRQIDDRRGYEKLKPW